MIAVVGAGLAGLATADALMRAGREAIVLEARDRVGGRVWSRELPDGSVVEMGAEFILPGNHVVEETARRLGLDRARVAGRGGTARTGDPWARGAYSIQPPGGHDPALAQAYGRLVLAGEHTAGPRAGLMEGALASGTRAAAQVLRPAA